MDNSHPMDNEDPHKPVAYDQYGRPLYAHPPERPVAVPQFQPVQQPQQPPVTPPAPGDTGASPAGNDQPQVVYMTRAIDPHQQEISPEAKAKHDESVKKYPHLNLSEGEYVINAIRRHPIGIISIWAVVIVVFAMLLLLPTMLLSLGVANFSPELLMNGGFVLLMVAILAFLAGLVATFVYDANRFYLTNESVTQHIQTGLFTKKDQTISLGNVEDASYRQTGIVQTILDYGSIRLSTQGEETTYRFNFVANPREQIRMLNDAVEAFKNFRPINSDDDDMRA